MACGKDRRYEGQVHSSTECGSDTPGRQYGAHLFLGGCVGFKFTVKAVYRLVAKTGVENMLDKTWYPM